MLVLHSLHPDLSQHSDGLEKICEYTLKPGKRWRVPPSIIPLLAPLETLISKQNGFSGYLWNAVYQSATCFLKLKKKSFQGPTSTYEMVRSRTRWDYASGNDLFWCVFFFSMSISAPIVWDHKYREDDEARCFRGCIRRFRIQLQTAFCRCKTFKWWL